jgi:chemotaxis protein CheX
MSTTVAESQPQQRTETKLALPFIKSTLNVFQSMIGIKPEIGKPRLKEGNGASFDYSGIIGFSGEIIGSVVVSFATDTAKKLVASFVGSDIETSSPDFADALGELTNMIAGGAKKDLGLIANISVPVVVMGHGHTIARLSGVPSVLIPFSTPHGDFAVEVNIKPSASTASFASK